MFWCFCFFFFWHDYFKIWSFQIYRISPVLFIIIIFIILFIIYLFYLQSTNTRVWLAHLSRSDLDVEVVPLVGDLEDLGPSKAVYPEPVPVDEQSVGAHP